MDWILKELVKRFRDIFLGVLSLISGLYMVISNDYNNITIIMIALIAFCYAIFRD